VLTAKGVDAKLDPCNYMKPKSTITSVSPEVLAIRGAELPACELGKKFK
jgi:hypothetical protein